MAQQQESATKAHSPNLETVIMVEKEIARKLEFDSRHQLWRSLPKQVQYQTFKTILAYLEISNKILIDKKGTVIWIFTDNPKLEQLHKVSKKLR